MIDKMQIEKEPDIKDILHAAAKKYNKHKLHFYKYFYFFIRRVRK